MDARELKDTAAEFFRKGKFTKAAESYLQLTKLEPKEGQHLIKLGDSYRRDGRKDEAIVAYRKAVDDYAKKGIVIKAIAACKLILEIDSNQKDAQEALATLCAKRYVRRDDLDASAPMRPVAKAPSWRGPIDGPIDLPEDDGEFGEIETTGAPAPSARAESRPSRPEPVRAPPPRVEALKVEAPRAGAPRQPLHLKPPTVAQAQMDSIDLDLGDAPAPPPKAPPARAVAAPPPPREPDPTALELDLGFDMPAPAQVVAKAPTPPLPPSTSTGDRRGRGQTFDLEAVRAELDSDEGDVLEGVLDDSPEDEYELPPGITMVTAENTDEHALLEDAERAAHKRPTAMADILSDSLLTEVDEGEEIELLRVTSRPIAPSPRPAAPVAVAPRQPSRPVAPPPDEIGADDLVAPSEAEEQAAVAAAQESQDERHEMIRMANEAAFDVTPAPADAEEEAVPLPLPPMASADVAQQNVPLFSELPPDAFVELLERLHFRRIDEGEVILREGDAGKSIFVLASGRAKVVKGLSTGEPIELATLDDGAFFGEMALLNGAPRVASVVAAQDCEVLELTEELLRELTAKHPSVATSLKKFYRQRLLSNVMAISPLFRAFDRGDRKMLVEKFKLREAKPDEAIISEGEKPDGLYVIMHGAALVVKKDPNGNRVMPLAVLKEGDVFGEMSLLSRKPASASVIAKRKTLVLRLPKSVFDELMFTHPAVLEVVSELTEQRSKVNEQILSGQVDAPREALAML